MDIFVIICFGSVFAALLEFAVINFITCYINRYKANEEKEKEAMEQLVKIVNEKLKTSDTMNGILSNELINRIQRTSRAGVSAEDKLKQYTDNVENVTNLEAIQIVNIEEEQRQCAKRFTAQLKIYCNKVCNKIPENYTMFFRKYYDRVSELYRQKIQIKPVPEMYIYNYTEDACEYIDERSRIIFPLMFIFMMSTYWTIYLFMYIDDTNIVCGHSNHSMYTI